MKYSYYQSLREENELLDGWKRGATQLLRENPHLFSNDTILNYLRHLSDARMRKNLQGLQNLYMDINHIVEMNEEKKKFIPFKKLTGSITTHPHEKKIDIWDADNQLVDKDLSRKKKVKKPRSKRKKCKCK